MDHLGRPTNLSSPPRDTPANPYPTPGSSAPGRKNKIVSVMRRSFSPRPPRSVKANDPRDGGYSYFHCEERAGSVPTVEQISMGLHLSRTPHLRSTNGRGRSTPSEEPTKPAHRPRPNAPPPKPALKKTSSSRTLPTSTTPSFTNISTSTSTTLSSTAFQKDRRISLFAPRLFSRMTKIIPSSQPRLSRDTVPGNQPDLEMSSQKKLVRFSVDETQ